MDFVIHYGPRAGFEDEALALARRLFAHFDEAIDSLSLIPISEDEFDLVLNGRLIASYHQSGHAPAVSDVIRSETALAPGEDSTMAPRPPINWSVAAAFSMVISAGGVARAAKTTPLITVDEGISALRKGSQASPAYQPPQARTA